MLPYAVFRRGRHGAHRADNRWATERWEPRRGRCRRADRATRAKRLCVDGTGAHARGASPGVRSSCITRRPRVFPERRRRSRRVFVLWRMDDDESCRLPALIVTLSYDEAGRCLDGGDGRPRADAGGIFAWVGATSRRTTGPSRRKRSVNASFPGRGRSARADGDGARTTRDLPHRWSRLKHEAGPSAGAGRARAGPADCCAAPAAARAGTPAMPAEPSVHRRSKPDPRIRLHPFLRPKVDEQRQRAALKKLFSDPHFNVMDGLDPYIDDYGRSPIRCRRRCSTKPARTCSP